MANEGKFQDRITTGGGKLVIDDSPIIPRQALTGLSTEDAFDLGKLDIQTNADLDLLGAAEQLRPKGEAGLKLDADLSKLDEGIRRIQAQQANQKVRELIKQAQAEMQRKNYKKAISLLDQALGIEPASGELWFLKGYAYMSMEDFELALVTLDKARQYSAGETMVFIIILQAACMRNMTEKVARRVNELVQKGQLPEALSLINQSLLKQPYNPALMYHRGGILMLMNRLQEAEAYVTGCIHQIGPQNAEMLTDLLDTIHFRKHEDNLEWARQALRRGAAGDAARFLDRFRGELDGIGKFDAIYEYACEKAGGKGVFSMFRKRGKPLTEQNRQQTLQWLMEEELGEGLQNLSAGNFAQSRDMLIRAYQLDQGCSLVNFLLALSTLRAFDHALQTHQQMDIHYEIQRLTEAARVAATAMSDPQMHEPAYNLLQTLNRYVEQMQEVVRQMQRSKQEAKPINDLLNEYGSLMDTIQKRGINSPKDIDAYEKKFRAMRDNAQRLRHGRKAEQGGKELGELIQAIDRSLAQLDDVREQAATGALLGECIQEFTGMMDYYKRKPISNYSQQQEAIRKIYGIQTKLERVKDANMGGDAGRTVQQLEEALNSVLRQLGG